MKRTAAEDWALWDEPPWYCDTCDSMHSQTVESCDGTFGGMLDEEPHPPVSRGEPATFEFYAQVWERWEARET